MFEAFERDLQAAAACHALGVLSGEEIVALARRSVDLARLPPEVCELATVGDEYPTVAGLGALFEDWLDVEGVVVPDRETAVWQALRAWIRRIATGEVSPDAGLVRMMAVYGLEERPCSEYLGDSHGIEHLVGDHWDRGEIRDVDALDEHAAEVVAHAKAWLQNYKG